MGVITEEAKMQEGEDAHTIGALNTLLMTVLLGLCFLCAYLIKKHKFHYVPESAAAIMVGVVVGGLAKLFNPTKDELDFLRFNPELFYFLLLPPIIFEAGYTLKKGHFFQNLGTITMFAVVGTLVSTIVVGYLLFWAAQWGLVSLDPQSPMEPLLFGALISAVDPVATLSIMGSPELNCDPLLYSLVFGESVLNDAVAIVLFNTFLREYVAHEEFSSATLPSVLWSFTMTSLGSLMMGAMIGLGGAFMYKHTRIRDHPKHETALLFLFAYGSYAFTEALGLSGIMALFFNGLLLSHYNIHNLSSVSKVTSQATFAVLALLSESLIFLYMGMGVFTGRFRAFDWTLITVSIVVILIARAANTFPFSFIANLGRRRKITMGMQVAIWFAGLRGAIAFALSQSMPGRDKDKYESTTLMIVVFTTLVCGGLTAPLLGRMNVKLQHGLSEENYEVNPYEQLGASMEGDEDGSAAASTTRAQRFRERRRRLSQRLGGSAQSLWVKLEGDLLQPLFGGPPGGVGGVGRGDEDDDEMGSVNSLNTQELVGMGSKRSSDGDVYVGAGGSGGDGGESGTRSNGKVQFRAVERSVSPQPGTAGDSNGFATASKSSGSETRPPLSNRTPPTRRP